MRLLINNMAKIRSNKIVFNAKNQVLKEKIDDFCDMKDTDCLITVDPGYNTALAAFYSNGIYIQKFSIPDKLAEIEKLYVAQVTFEKALGNVSDYAIGTANGSGRMVLIENVSVWGESGASGKANAGKISQQSEVSSARGDLLKLARLIGVYCGKCFDNDDICNLITAINWKGQLTKKATKEWVEMELGCSLDVTDHEIDAIGIGLSTLNEWKGYK
jgi:hypothetical protein